MSALSGTLLGPVSGQLQRKRLLVVADGALQYVPFGALPEPPPAAAKGGVATGGYRPLIAGHEVVSLPSASVVALLRSEAGRRAAATKTVAVLADPVFGKDDPRVKAKAGAPVAQKGADGAVAPASDVERSANDPGVTTFDRLPVSRREAQLIEAAAPKGQSLVAVDFAASRATAMSAELGGYQIVHFATHSLIDDRHPELSGIVLSLVDERGQPQDGFLRLHDIYNMRLDADLVVLSACQTALGQEVRGEGLVGLTRGFMYAGAPRVVASMWNVGDEATAELMSRFYKNMLGKGMRPAAALREAQVSMWKERRWAAPYYWAGFVLQGEWR
jgi:CHAT domain-containing protein